MTHRPDLESKDRAMNKIRPTYIICPECYQPSKIADWIETELGCEDCGSHPAIKCPKCEYTFDLIYYDPITDDSNYVF